MIFCTGLSWDNGHKFSAGVVPEEVTDTALFLGHNQSGHNGYQRTYAAMKHIYYWKGMRKCAGSLYNMCYL